MNSDAFKIKYLEILDKVGKVGFVSLTTYTELIVEILDSFEQIELKLEEFTKKEEDLLRENHILWIDYRNYKFKIYLDAERNTLVGDVLLNDEIDVVGLESDSITHLITEMERAVDNQISWNYQSELAKEVIEKNIKIKELEQELEKLKNDNKAIIPSSWFKDEQDPEAIQRLLKLIDSFQLGDK